MEENPTILIVEDSSTQAHYIAGHLSGRDVDVIIADDGPQGLRIIQGMKPSLVVLDINLPTMDGYQVCRRIKRDPDTQAIPVVMFTSNNTDEERERGLRAGADGYICKGNKAVQQLLDLLGEMGLLAAIAP